MRLACWRRRPAFADFPAKIVSVQSHARGFWGAQAETVFSNRCDNSTDCCRQAAGNCGLAARAPQNTERENAIPRALLKRPSVIPAEAER